MLLLIIAAEGFEGHFLLVFTCGMQVYMWLFS